jgi:hypothetical protein
MAAAALAAMPKVSRVHLIDPEPSADRAFAFETSIAGHHRGRRERLSILGHASMSVDARRLRLTTESSRL